MLGCGCSVLIDCCECVCVCSWDAGTAVSCCVMPATAIRAAVSESSSSAPARGSKRYKHSRFTAGLVFVVR